jgi:hypothetical protein
MLVLSTTKEMAGPGVSVVVAVGVGVCVGMAVAICNGAGST